VIFKNSARIDAMLSKLLQSVYEIIEGGNMQFDKFSTCKKMIYLLLGFLLLCCCGVLVALKFEMGAGGSDPCDTVDVIR
jgi:hypothetical protein